MLYTPRVFITYLGTTRDQHRIICSETSVTFVGVADEFPRYEGPDLWLGKCPLAEDFYVKADYEECGLTREIKGKITLF